MLKFRYAFFAQVYDPKGTGISLNLWSKKLKNTQVATYQCLSSKKKCAAHFYLN